VWDFVVGTRERMPHHDVAALPGGNVLAIVWERKTGKRPFARAEGRSWWATRTVARRDLEIAPGPPRGGEIVWEWHVWDHLVQEHDPARSSYGTVTSHPELVDINGGPPPSSLTDEALERLRSLGYVLRGAPPPDLRADFLHTNSIAYNPALDQVALSVSRLGELWVIDHGTTTKEAAGHSGGRAGRGGDLLYRWGTPGYGRGSTKDQQLHGQHDVRWIPADCPGAGNLMAFDNGSDRPAWTTPRSSRSPRPSPATGPTGSPGSGVRSGASDLDVHGGRPALVLRRFPVGSPPPAHREHLHLLRPSGHFFE